MTITGTNQIIVTTGLTTKRLMWANVFMCPGGICEILEWGGGCHRQWSGKEIYYQIIMCVLS